jgi:hypothetical protein
MNLRTILSIKNVREEIFSYLNQLSRYCIRLGVVPCKLNKNGKYVPIMYVKPFYDPLCYKCEGFYRLCGDQIRSCSFCGNSGHSTCIKREKFAIFKNKCDHPLTIKYIQHRECFQLKTVDYCGKCSNKIPSILRKKKKTTMQLDMMSWENLQKMMVSKKKDVTDDQLVEHRMSHDKVYKKKEEMEEAKKKRKIEIEKKKTTIFNIPDMKKKWKLNGRL